jgi:hypothetical protein
MFGRTDSYDGAHRTNMSANDGLLDRIVLLDVLVNVVPIGILAFFVVLFAVYAPYPGDPVVLVIQMSLILVPGVVVAVVTYYAVRVVTKDERAGGPETPPGYSQADAETAAPSDDN